MANVNGILGISEVRLLSDADALHAVDVVPMYQGWAVMVGVRDSESGYIKWKCMTKAQSLEVRVFSSLDTAFKVISSFWSEKVEVML